VNPAEPNNIDELVRAEGRHVLATLVRLTGDIGLAEDAVHDAIESALATWQRNGIPRRPAAWLTTTARNKALDRLRREGGRSLREQQAAWIGTTPTPSVTDLDDMFDELFPESILRDDQLRLLFTACHPALSSEARVALALRTIGGMSTYEIATALRVPEPTIAQRIVRAKRKIASAHIPYRVPDDHELPTRLRSVLDTVFSIFTAGHHPASGAIDSRLDLATEGQRLAAELAALMPDEPECLGLYALTLATHARRHTRVHTDGTPILMSEQDRSMWDHQAIQRASDMVERVLTMRRVGTFQLQAAISCLHGLAATFAETDWPQIAELYGLLYELQPTPVVRVNWAIAAGEASGAEAGLLILSAIDTAAVEHWHMYWAARSDLEQRVGLHIQAHASLARALTCAMNEGDRVILSQRLRELTETQT
jgi:RNA polymerase sigma-70 factor, ECF subfamily